MEYQRNVRRSDRVLIRLPLEIWGLDESGQSFSEQGITHFIARHGCSLMLPRKLAVEQQVTIRRPGGIETQVRVVGQIGIGPEGNLYGVAFVSRAEDFWGVRFPTTPDPDALGKLVLECEVCKTRQIAELDAIHLEVFRTNDEVSRQCEKCGQVTRWTEALFDAPVIRAHRVEDANAPAPQESGPEPEPVEQTGVERRQHPRLELKMTACIPPPDGFGPDDVVQVLDISKGGLQFRSLRRYMVGQWVQVAVPYTPGAANIFTQSRVAWRAPAGDRWCRYGLKYIKLAV